MNTPPARVTLPRASGWTSTLRSDTDQQEQSELGSVILRSGVRLDGRLDVQPDGVVHLLDDAGVHWTFPKHTVDAIGRLPADDDADTTAGA